MAAESPPAARAPGLVLFATPLDLVVRLSLLTLLLAPIGTWAVRPMVLGLAALALLFPALSRRPGLWFALAGLAAARVASDWPLSDNHAYLLVYWCLALGLALACPRPAVALAWNGRALIGLVFGLAVIQKWASPDYLDQTFFRYTLLVDPRFEDVARLLGMTLPELEAGRSWIESASAEGAFRPTRAFSTFASIATWGTLALEMAVAVGFLLPKRLGAVWRDGALLAFCVVTYAIAPVAGFGWLLLTMGLAQCAGVRTRTQASYLAVWALVLFYREVDWPHLVVMAFGVG